MTGQQPKEGIGFELYVATALKTEAHPFDGRPLDLTDFNFNVNPKTYPSEGTGAGYPVTVDITASNGDFDFIIECKSSIHCDEILEINGEPFLKAMLEFLAMRSFYQKMNWNAKYILATNFPIARKVRNLDVDANSCRLKKLQKILVSYGNKKYSKFFNPTVASLDFIAAVFRNLTFFQLSDQFLKSKMSTDENYRKNLEVFSSNLRRLRTQNDAGNGLSEVSHFRTVSFLCKSEKHDKCRDVLIGETVCHIGNINKIISIIRKSNMSGIYIKRMTARELGFSVKDIQYPITLSPEKAAEALSEALTKRFESKYCVYVVPGIFDLLLINKNGMVNKIKTSFDKENLRKYKLDEIKELEGFGAVTKVSVARFILSQFGLPYSEECFISDEE